MNFPFNTYLIAFLTAAGITFLSMPGWRRWCYRTGLVDDPGHRKIHDQPIALAGGLAVLAGILLSLVLGAVAVAYLERRAGPLTDGAGIMSGLKGDDTIARLLGHGFDRRAGQLVIMILGGIGMVVLGWLDDKYELKPKIKFGGQFLIAFLTAASGIRITLFVDSLLFSYAITMLWILTVTNAFNFMDNMNGLCAGLGAVGAWCFFWNAGEQGQYLVALLACLVSGALVGFLPYNFPKASVFLGDAGSHLVGYLLSVLAILPHFYSKANPKVLAVLHPLLILAVPLGDLVWVVIYRWRIGQPFYIGDNNHLSHRLVRRGWTRAQAVLIIWLLALGIGGVSFLY